MDECLDTCKAGVEWQQEICLKGCVVRWTDILMSGMVDVMDYIPKWHIRLYVVVCMDAFITHLNACIQTNENTRSV